MTTRQDKASTYLVERCANLCANLCENLQIYSISDQPIDTILLYHVTSSVPLVVGPSLLLARM